MNTYTDHVILSVDEARRHQRGEAVGHAYVPPKPEKPKSREFGTVPDDIRCSIAFSPLPIKDTAKAFGVSVATVCGIRREFGTARPRARRRTT